MKKLRDFKIDRTTFSRFFKISRIGPGSFKNKSIITFAGIYLFILSAINIIFALLTVGDWEGGLELLGSLFTSFSFASFPCAASLLDSAVKSKNLSCQVNYGIILLNIYLAAVSLYLIFYKKLKFRYWILIFVLINILAGFVLIYRDRLYLNI